MLEQYGVLLRIKARVTSDTLHVIEQCSAALYDRAREEIYIGISGLCTEIGAQRVILTTGFPFSLPLDTVEISAYVELAMDNGQSQWVRTTLKHVLQLSPPPLFRSHSLKWSVAVLEAIEEPCFQYIRIDRQGRAFPAVSESLGDGEVWSMSAYARR